jgi:type I restriction enzyme S subunit
MVLQEWGHASGAASGKLAFQRNDILFGKLRPYFRKVGVVPTDGICSTDIIVVRPRRAEDLGYVLAVATDPAFIDASNAASTGTRMPRTSWADLARYPLRLPPPSMRATFTSRVWPLIERAQAAGFETRTLERIRDALLPRLLSGELSPSSDKAQGA